MELHDIIGDLPIIYQTPKIEFYMDLPRALLISYAKAFSGEAEYRVNMQACADLCAEHALRYIIFESANFKGTSPANQKWVSEYLVPHFKELGVRAIALVMSKDIFGKFALNSMAKRSELAYTGGLPFQFTDSFADSYQWILEQREELEQQT